MHVTIIQILNYNTNKNKKQNIKLTQSNTENSSQAIQIKKLNTHLISKIN